MFRLTITGLVLAAHAGASIAAEPMTGAEMSIRFGSAGRPPVLETGLGWFAPPADPVENSRFLSAGGITFSRAGPGVSFLGLSLSDVGAVAAESSYNWVWWTLAGVAATGVVVSSMSGSHGDSGSGETATTICGNGSLALGDACYQVGSSRPGG